MCACYILTYTYLVRSSYLEFPAAAGEPPRVLRGFHKVSLGVGASTAVSFPLSRADASIWDVAAQRWRVVVGEFGVAVGASSRDLHLRGTVTVADPEHSV